VGERRRARVRAGGSSSSSSVPTLINRASGPSVRGSDNEIKNIK